MRNVNGYANEITTQLGFDEAIEKVTGLLKDEGFGILTEIDVTETLKKKLDVDYKPFRILGACNPPFAHQVLEAVPHVSVLLPCNVVVWDEGSHRVVAAMDANVMGQVIDDPTVREVASQVSAKLSSVLEKLQAV